MRIAQLTPKSDWTLLVATDDGRHGCFDVKPYLQDEAFHALRNADEFMKVANGGYFVEWDCGADLSADTIEAKWHESGNDTAFHARRVE